MVGIGFCSRCQIRIFGNEIQGEDYILVNNDFICSHCLAPEEDESDV